MAKIRKCNGCDIEYLARRSNHLYHSDKCRDKTGKAARLQRREDPRGEADTVGFAETVAALDPPSNAIGYRLLCRELEDLRLPITGTARWDGTRPRTDFYRIRPLELPLVPIKTVYLLDWVLPGGGGHKLEKPIFIHFSRHIRNREVEDRMKRYRMERPVVPALACQLEQLAAPASLPTPGRVRPALPNMEPPQSPPLLAHPATPMPPAALPAAVSIEKPAAPLLTPVEILEAIKHLGPEALAAFQSALLGTLPVTTP